jgi:hypothetical protein
MARYFGPSRPWRTGAQDFMVYSPVSGARN